MGLDLTNEQRLAALYKAFSRESWRAQPMLGDRPRDGAARELRNPADPGDLVGTVVEATPELVDAACARAVVWSASPEARADCLRRVADRMEARLLPLIGLIVREAGKTFANAVGEVREAVDFLRYYAAQVA